MGVFACVRVCVVCMLYVLCVCVYVRDIGVGGGVCVCGCCVCVLCVVCVVFVCCVLCVL